MIPIKLSIEGLYSYQQRQTIDFNKLTSNHLFGIFGTVGSGKSSILEAITFALYGKTDRLLLSGDNRNYNMMNLKSNVLFIEFDFIAGKKGQEFRVQVSAKRNSKKYEEVKKADRIVYKKIGDDFVPIAQDELEETIGLSYDNFKRTIIIPQGRFQEFLQLKNAERTQMMKELFSLQKYELSPKVKNLELQNNANIQHIEGRLEQLGDISSEQIEILNKQLQELEKNITSLSNTLKTQDDTIIAFEKLKEHTELLKTYEAQHSLLNKQKEHILQLEKDIAGYEYCIIKFKSTLDAISLHEKKEITLKENLNKDKQSLSKKQEDYDKLKKDYKTISESYAKLDELKKEVENLKKLIEINVLSQTIGEETNRLKNGERTVKDVVDKIKHLQNQEKTSSENLIELKKNQPNIEVINEAQQWHLKNKNTNTAITDAKNEKAIALKQINKLQEDLKQKASEHTYSFSSDNKDQCLLELNNTLQDQEKELKRMNEKREQLLIHLGLENYAKQLQDEEACPLCGSEHHPNPLSSEDISKQLEQVKIEADKQNASIDKSRKLINLIENNIASTKPIEIQLVSIDEKTLRLNKEAKEHQKQIIEVYKDEALLAKEANQYKNISASISKTELLLVQLREQYSKENLNKEKYQEALSKIQRMMDKNVSSKEVLTKQIPNELIIKYKNVSNDEIIESTKTIEKSISAINANYEKTRQNIEETKKTIAVIEGQIVINNKHLKTETEQIIQLTSTLNEDIKKSSFSNLESILNTLQLQLNIEASKHNIQEFHQNIQRVNIEIKKTIEILDGKTYDVEKHQAAVQLAKENKDKLTASNREYGKIQTTLTDLNKKITLQKDLNEQLKKLHLRGDDINTLRKLFYKSGFVNYISSVYLQNLCSTANERFYKMTRQSLSLELSEDNNFEVRDYMNGGKLRSVKTLSGGQTFQAALSLALALADNIQSLTETNKNFFFLDEGFGSLDKDSLDIVFGTLKNLRNENRIVGVISHVEEMQQEITTYLNIKQNEETGSSIEESWNR